MRGTKTVYAPHLDGMRALAVVLIVTYHAFPVYFPGGYIGVDVFFVISGFLITGIIARDLDTGCFSVTAFYARRIRRIFPSLIVVLLACYALGWFILIPDELRLLGKHMAAAAGFVINFVLWGEAGYFDTMTALKPLVHLWSLGVEEQFYLAFPALMLLARRAGIRLMPTILSIGAASLIANLLLTDKFPTASFYLPHTRMWEILSGGVLALWLADSSITTGRSVLRDTSAACGAVLIIGAGIMLRHLSSYPGAWALLPVAGSLLLISAGGAAWFNRVVLANPVCVWIGLISFPLYLWHWPLLSFARIVYSGEPDSSVKLALVALTVALAAITYGVVERPIRARPPTLIRVCALALASLCVGALGYRAMALDGLPSRLNRSQMSYRDALATTVNGQIAANLIVGGCSLVPSSIGYSCQSDRREPPSFALVGDSHATALYQGVVATSLPGQRWEVIGGAGCMFITNLIRKNSDPCDALAEPVVDALANDASIKTVMFALWRGQLEIEYLSLKHPASGVSNQQLFTDGLSDTFDRLEAAGKQVILLIDNPMIVFDPKPCVISRPVTFGKPDCTITRSEHEKAMEPFRRMADQLKARHPKLRVYDPTDVYCTDQCAVVRDGKSMYFDFHHLSDFGASLAGRGLAASIRDIGAH